MKAVFKVLEGPIEHESLAVRDGELITIGREQKADIPVPGDGQLSSLHLSVNCTGDECVIQDLNSTNGTFLNDKRLTEPAAVVSGDVIRCGGLRFEVALSGGAAPPAPIDRKTTVVAEAGGATDDSQSAPKQAATATAPGRAQAAQTDPVLEQVRGFTEDTAEAVVQRFQLADLALVPSADESPEAFATRLKEAEHLEDALKFFAYALPKRPAVWWLTRCVRHVVPEPPEADQAVLEVAEKWVVSPTDETRRKGMDLAQKQECATAACWAAVAAFWSHGSMVPPNVPPVLPKDEFTGKAVSGAIAIAAAATEPKKAPQKRSAFFDLALAVAAGQNTWVDA